MTDNRDEKIVLERVSCIHYLVLEKQKTGRPETNKGFTQ